MLTHSMKKKILDIIIGRDEEGQTEAYLGLSTTQPTFEGDNFTEPSADDGYERVLLGSPKAKIYRMKETSINLETTIASSENDKEIHFNESTGSWGEINYFGIFSSATGGKPIYIGNLISPIDPEALNVVVIRKGDIYISIE